MIRILAALAFLMPAALLPAAAQANGCYINDGLGWVIAKATSQQRQVNGLGPVEMDPRLILTAEAQACDMAQKGFFDHAGSDGSTVMIRAKREGYRACLIAENIAMGQRNPRVTFDDWMKSPGHRRNILLKDVTQIGVAVVPKRGGKGPWYVMVLARPCE